MALKNAVRYVAASFEDLGGEIVGEGDWSGEEKTEAGDWKYPLMHDPFSILMNNYGIHVLKEGEKEETL